MGDLLLLGAAFAFGVGSALLPMFLNAELYVVGMGAFVPDSLLWLAIISLGVGTVLGKWFVFELARKGSSKLRSVDRPASHGKWRVRLRRFSDWMLGLLDRPYLGSITVMSSCLFGVPPLAIVTIMSGASNQPRWLFLNMVFIGRTVQFLAIAYVIHGVV